MTFIRAYHSIYRNLSTISVVLFYFDFIQRNFIQWKRIYSNFYNLPHYKNQNNNTKIKPKPKRRRQRRWWWQQQKQQQSDKLRPTSHIIYWTIVLNIYRLNDTYANLGLFEHYSCDRRHTHTHTHTHIRSTNANGMFSVGLFVYFYFFDLIRPQPSQAKPSQDKINDIDGICYTHNEHHFSKFDAILWFVSSFFLYSPPSLSLLLSYCFSRNYELCAVFIIIFFSSPFIYNFVYLFVS